MDPLQQLMMQLQQQQGAGGPFIQPTPTPMTGGSGDPMQMLSRIQSLTPEQMDQVAGQLAANPQMQPPPPGSFGQMAQQLQSFPGQQAGPMAPPPYRTQDPVQAGLETPNPQLMQQIQQRMGAGQGQGQPTNLGALLGALKQNEQKPPPAAYISNLGFGGATPAKGLGLQAPQRANVGSLGQYL